MAFIQGIFLCTTLWAWLRMVMSTILICTYNIFASVTRFCGIKTRLCYLVQFETHQRNNIGGKKSYTSVVDGWVIIVYFTLDIPVNKKYKLYLHNCVFTYWIPRNVHGYWRNRNHQVKHHREISSYHITRIETETTRRHWFGLRVWRKCKSSSLLRKTTGKYGIQSSLPDVFPAKLSAASATYVEQPTAVLQSGDCIARADQDVALTVAQKKWWWPLF